MEGWMLDGFLVWLEQRVVTCRIRNEHRVVPLCRIGIN